MATDSDLVLLSDAKIRKIRLDSGNIFVIDGLFSEDMVAFLHTVFGRLPFVRNEYDTPDHRDYPALNCEFMPRTFERNPQLHQFHSTIVGHALALFPKTAFELVRVHCNAQDYGDTQFAHSDITGGMTALYHANAEWHDEWHGETLFYGSGDEATHAVAFRPGRVLVFAADIIHRGGLPSAVCKDRRLTVAFKFRQAAQ